MMFRVCRVWLDRWGLLANLDQKGMMADQASRGLRGLKVSFIKVARVMSNV